MGNAGTGQGVPCYPTCARSASLFCTCAADGLHIVEPSGNSRVGTVWLPPLTLSTNFAASGSRSMSTSMTSTPTLPSCRLRFLQNPHQVVVYIVSGTVGLLVVPDPTAGVGGPLAVQQRIRVTVFPWPRRPRG